MLTRSAANSRPDRLDNPYDTVTTMATLRAAGWTEDARAHQLAARRWQLFGRAIVLHNGPIHPDERARIVLLNCGPRALLTAFTAAELHGLQHWHRPEIHVLVPAGARVCRLPDIPTRLHYTGRWPREPASARRLEPVAPALVRAASTFDAPRPACAILAAGVQQRLVSAAGLRSAVAAAPRVRHRRVLLATLADIGQGSEALSEIDFVQLCRRYRLPAPRRQAVRATGVGRRRYLDAEWLRSDGRRIVAEVDGALHLTTRNWWGDQARQNELVLGGDLVLRFPAVVVRTDPAGVARQLHAALNGC